MFSPIYILSKRFENNRIEAVFNNQNMLLYYMNKVCNNPYKYELVITTTMSNFSDSQIGSVIKGQHIVQFLKGESIGD